MIASRFGCREFHSRQFMWNGSATASPNCSSSRSWFGPGSVNSIRRKKSPPSDRSSIDRSDDVGARVEQNRDTALTIPGRSGHAISSRSRLFCSGTSVPTDPAAGS